MAYRDCLYIYFLPRGNGIPFRKNVVLPSRVKVRHWSPFASIFILLGVSKDPSGSSHFDIQEFLELCVSQNVAWTYAGFSCGRGHENGVRG